MADAALFVDATPPVPAWLAGGGVSPGGAGQPYCDFLIPFLVPAPGTWRKRKTIRYCISRSSKLLSRPIKTKGNLPTTDQKRKGYRTFTQQIMKISFYMKTFHSLNNFIPKHVFDCLTNFQENKKELKTAF